MSILHIAITMCLVFGLCAMSCAAQEIVETPVVRRNYNASDQSNGLFSAVVKHGDVLYLSGVTAFGSAAQGKSVAEQARIIFARIRAIAEAEGIDLSSLIKVTIFITDVDTAPKLREELARQYAGQPPASSLVEVSGLFSPEINIEIEAILGLPNGDMR